MQDIASPGLELLRFGENLNAGSVAATIRRLRAYGKLEEAEFSTSTNWPQSLKRSQSCRPKAGVQRGKRLTASGKLTA